MFVTLGLAPPLALNARSTRSKTAQYAQAGMAMELLAVPGSQKHDLASLDPDSLVAASYLQLLSPGDYSLEYSSDRDLPALKHRGELIPAPAILHRLEASASASSSSSTGASRQADAKAFHALLDSTLLPLVLHSLYSLPQNWLLVRSLLADALPFPTAYYRPNALRAHAQHTVEAAHPEWWGLGGEAEKEQEEERKRKKALLETGIEGIKERKDGERREGKERMRKTFGEGKVSPRDASEESAQAMNSPAHRIRSCRRPASSLRRSSRPSPTRPRPSSSPLRRESCINAARVMMSLLTDLRSPAAPPRSTRTSRPSSPSSCTCPSRPLSSPT